MDHVLTARLGKGIEMRRGLLDVMQFLIQLLFSMRKWLLMLRDVKAFHLTKDAISRVLR